MVSVTAETHTDISSSAHGYTMIYWTCSTHISGDAQTWTYHCPHTSPNLFWVPSSRQLCAPCPAPPTRSLVPPSSQSAIVCTESTSLPPHRSLPCHLFSTILPLTSLSYKMQTMLWHQQTSLLANTALGIRTDLTGPVRPFGMGPLLNRICLLRYSSLANCSLNPSLSILRTSKYPHPMPETLCSLLWAISPCS